MARMSFPPGFRFHATDIELIMYYLKRKVMGKKLHFDAVTELNIYKFSPWDLPDKCLLKSKDLEWYFFSPSEKKYGSGARTNRATETGYWKATGKDRPVIYNQRTVGMIKTLIFHEGHAPKGHRTDWVMHEYRLEDENLVDVVQDAYRLCKFFQKSGLGPKNGAQYGAPFKEEDWSDMEETCVESSSVACQIFSDCVLPSNKNNSDAVSLTVPGNSAHRSTSEPDPSTDRPLDFNMQTGMKEICVESSSIDAHVSYNYVPPGHVQSSVAISTTVPGNSSVWCTSNSGLSKAGPPVMDMPSNPSDLLDEDFDALLDMFVEHINMPENKCNEKFENNGILPCLNENGIYNELGDLNDWMELSETGFNILTTEWMELSETGFNILKTEDAAYNLNPLLLFDETPFLELDDLNTPLRCHAETGEFKSMHTESTYAAHTYERSMGINVSYSDGDYLSSLENVSGWNDPSALLEESHLPGNSFK